MKRFPQLHMIDSDYATRSVEVTGPTTIGRDTANDIVLAEATNELMTGGWFGRIDGSRFLR